MVEADGVTLYDAVELLVESPKDRVEVYKHRWGWYRQMRTTGLRPGTPEDAVKIARVQSQMTTQLNLL